MKFIFSFLFSIFLCIPSFADQTPNQCSGETDRTMCNSIGGCYWDDEFSDACEQCGDTSYSAPNDTECTPCDSGLAFTEESHKVYDATIPGHPGQSTCPWKCDTGYFRDNAGENCLLCPNGGAVESYHNYYHPNHSTTVPNMQGVAQNINECFQDSNGGVINPCGTGKYLIQTTASATDTQPVYFCGICGDNGTLVSNNYGLQDFQINTCPDCNTSAFVNTYYGQRGTNPRVQCDCPDNSTLNDGVCTCNAPLHIVQDPDTNQSHCAQCPDNASPSPTNNTQCKCNIGFYGDGDSSCARCPNGATTVATGSTELSDCKIKSNAKFCIDTSTSRTLDLTNGRHCFYLHSTPNQHNGYTAADIH